MAKETYDVLIIGAGPVGLFQVFELGLLEIKAHVIDSLAYVGGQCVELYPDKPIYDIPAVPVCTGKELTDNLLKQIEPFGATFHLGQEVTGVEKRVDGRFDVQTSKGTRFVTKTVFIAGGVSGGQDLDLCVRLGAAGWTVAILPDVHVLHHHGATHGGPVQQFAQEAVQVRAGRHALGHLMLHGQHQQRGRGARFQPASWASFAATIRSFFACWRKSRPPGAPSSCWWTTRPDC